MIETERLLLREYTMDDFDALYEIMSDPETMQHYPAPFDEARTRRWISRASFLRWQFQSVINSQMKWHYLPRMRFTIH